MFKFGTELTKAFNNELNTDVYEFIISSENIDKVGDRMVVDGVDLNEFKNNPNIY